MPASITGQTQPWFTINESLSGSVSSGVEISVAGVSAVAFNVSVNVTIGSLPEAFFLPVGTPLGIDSSTSSIMVDAPAFMFAMGGA